MAHRVAALSGVAGLPVGSAALTRAPHRPDQLGHLGARQPAVAGLASLWKRHFHDLAVVALAVVMPDRSGEVLQIPSRAAGIAPMGRVGPAGSARDLGEGLATPPVQDPLQALRDAVPVRVLRDVIGCVDAQDVRDRDLIEATA